MEPQLIESQPGAGDQFGGEFAVFFLDLDGNIESLNKAAEKITGYAADELTGKNFKVFYTDKDNAADVPGKLIQQAIVSGEAKQMSVQVRKSGEGFVGNVLITAQRNKNNSPKSVTAIVSIPNKSNWARTLTKNEARLIKMISEIDDYGLVLMDVEGNIEHWNKGAENIKGYTAEEATGKNFRIFYGDADVAALRPDNLIALAKTEGAASDEGWKVRKNGERFWGAISITAIHDFAGNVIGYGMVTRDLSEKKAAEDNKLLAMKTEAKNKELEQITYIASHDLQEPLRTIKSLSKILSDEYYDKLDETAKTSFTFMHEATSRMQSLIKGMLDYSRIGRNVLAQKIDTDHVVKQVCADLAVVIDETKATVNTDKLPVIEGYETEFRLLVQNLISNAIKFRKPDVAPQIHITAEDADGYYRFAVADNGIGIEPEYADRIFFMFQRLNGREKYDGYGIGLAHCKKIAELHHGEIWVKSAPGNGSTFYFTIRKNLK